MRPVSVKYLDFFTVVNFIEFFVNMTLDGTRIDVGAKTSDYRSDIISKGTVGLGSGIVSKGIVRSGSI